MTTRDFAATHAPNGTYNRIAELEAQNAELLSALEAMLSGTRGCGTMAEAAIRKARDGR